MSLALSSPAFGQNGQIPQEFTCDGADRSPPLDWSGPPAGTKSLALIVDDPDAPDPRAPERTYVHWVLYDMPPSARGLTAGGSNLPTGTKVGTNDWKRVAYGGPCPPIGRHRYFFKLYALDLVLGNRGPQTKAQLEEAIKGHILEHAELIGTYERAKPHAK